MCAGCTGLGCPCQNEQIAAWQWLTKTPSSKAGAGVGLGRVRPVPIPHMQWNRNGTHRILRGWAHAPENAMAKDGHVALSPRNVKNKPVREGMIPVECKLNFFGTYQTGFVVALFGCL